MATFSWNTTKPSLCRIDEQRKLVNISFTSVSFPKFTIFTTRCVFVFPQSHFLWISLAPEKYFPVGHRETWDQCKKPRKKINRKLLGWLIVAISAIAVQCSQFVLFPKPRQSCMSLLFSHMCVQPVKVSTCKPLRLRCKI